MGPMPFRRSKALTRGAAVLLLGCGLSVGFFDFFGKPAPEPDKSEVKTASYGQLKVLTSLRKSKQTSERWDQLCQSTGCGVETMPAEVVREFILEPLNHKTGFLQSFASVAALPQLPAQVDEEELGGFMDSNRFGLVKSPKQLAEEQVKLAQQVQSFIAESEANAAQWRQFCLDKEDLFDPEDEESHAVRHEMGVRSELGRRKTALESWLDAQTGNEPKANGWGV
ncbi:unnamed protein product [Effrenium voratum]|nr:unnamed protein product [Effrenium voratum]